MIKIAIALCWFVVGVFAVGTSAILLDDSCRVNAYSSTKEGDVVNIPRHCTNGTVWWDWPQETLRLKVSRMGQFDVCFSNLIGTIGGMREVLRGQKITMETSGDRDEVVCTPEPATDSVILELDAPKYQLYGLFIDFEVNPA